MVKTWLASDETDQLITTQVEGKPVGEYATSIMALFVAQNLATLLPYFALPVYSRNQPHAHWFYQGITSEVLTWQQASETQRYHASTELMQVAAKIQNLRDQLSKYPIAVQLLDAIMIIPSAQSLRIINQHPVMLNWGSEWVNGERLDLVALQASLLAKLPARPTESVLTAPSASLPIVEETKPRRNSVTPTAVMLLLLFATIAIFFISQRHNAMLLQASTHVTPSTPAKKTQSRAVASHKRLPLEPATLAQPVKPLAAISSHQLTTPPIQASLERKMAALEGRWRFTGDWSNQYKRVQLMITKGQATSQFTVGNIHCTAQNRVFWSNTGKFTLLSAPAKCTLNRHITFPQINCESSQSQTRCYWRDTKKKSHRVIMEQE